MLTGPRLAAALVEAMKRKGVKNVDVAQEFDVKPPSVSEWRKFGRIGKEHISHLVDYFSDVVGPAHWGLSNSFTVPGEEVAYTVESNSKFSPTRALPKPELPFRQSGEFDLPIPLLSVSAAMGDGALAPDHIDTVRQLTVDLRSLRQQCTFTNPKSLRFITAYGSSMEPTFRDGDILLIDEGVKEFDNIDGVYCFTYGEDFGLMIKSLQRDPNTKRLRAISHNRAGYDPFDIDPTRPFQIHGRVVLAWNARRL